MLKLPKMEWISKSCGQNYNVNGFDFDFSMSR